MLRFCLIFSLAVFVISFLMVAVLRRRLNRRFLDMPDQHSSRTRPTPRGGGLAIVVATLAGCWLAWPFLKDVLTLSQLVIFSLGGLLIAGVSWVDDMRSLSTRLRLAAHIVGAILVCCAFGVWQSFLIPGVGALALGWLGWPMTIVWIVGLTNAYNFMDGIDGIAGAQAVMAGLGWLIIGILAGNVLLCVLGVLLASACAGFLGHNWPPAKIFMGDVGSAFLGFVFAALPIMAARDDARFALAGILLVWPFVFDATLTFVRRLLKRENVFAAHRSHLYQRLVISGLSHQVVVLIYGVADLIGLVLAVLLIRNCMYISVIAPLALVFASLGLWGVTLWREMLARQRSI